MTACNGARCFYFSISLITLTFIKLSASSTQLVVTFHTRELAQQAYPIPVPITVLRQYGRRLVLNFGKDVNITEDSEIVRSFIDSSLIERIELDGIASATTLGSPKEPFHLRSEDMVHGAGTYYSSHQWNLWPTESHGIHAQYLWDHSHGSSDVVVAVVDCGIAAKGKTFLRNYVKGYDFVSQDTNDGDGWDPDETDPGTGGGGCTDQWHGTKVSSIIASRHDGLINGVAQNCSLMNVRVLGRCGNGYSTDVADAILWAAGGALWGVPNNPRPAKIINLSLAGKDVCFNYLQSAINEAVRLGAIIVVAAGNGNENADLYWPVNCDNVIVVGGSTRAGGMTGYTNYGSRVDISAPGGEESGNYMLMTSYSSGSDSLYTLWEYGTSFSAPQIAGILSIWVHLLTLFPLDTSKLKKLLSSSSTPFAVDCKNAAGCGPGIVKAQLKHDKFVTFCSQNSIQLSMGTTLWQYGIENKCCRTCKESVNCGSSCTSDYNYCRKQCLEPCPVGQYRSLCSYGNTASHICSGCKVCVPGEYKTLGCDRFSNSECSPCPSNTYSTTNDVESCTTCASTITVKGMYKTGCGGGSNGTYNMCTNGPIAPESKGPNQQTQYT